MAYASVLILGRYQLPAQHDFRPSQKDSLHRQSSMTRCHPLMLHLVRVSKPWSNTSDKGGRQVRNENSLTIFELLCAAPNVL